MDGWCDVAVIVAFLLASAMAIGAQCDAEANDTTALDELRVSDALRELADVDDERAERLAVIIEDAGEQHGIDPLLLVAIGMRESGWQERYERLQRFGSMGEVGLMQTHGVALRFRPAGCTAELRGARCQIETGAAFLAHVRSHCRGPIEVWVGAYGMSACPTVELAAMHQSVRRVRRYYEMIGGEWR